MDDQCSKIKLIRPGHFRHKTIEVPIGHGNLSDFLKRYHQGLEDLKRRLDKSNIKQEDFDKLTDAFEKCFAHNKWLYSQLFGNEKEIADITNYLKKYLYLKSRVNIGVIQVRATNIKHIIPIECLVMVGTESKVKKKQDVAKTASGILGFSFIINRVVKGNPQSQKRELKNVPQLPIKYFYDEALRGSKSELSFFEDEKYKRYFNLDGPWPLKGTKFTVKDVVRYLSQPNLRFEQIAQIETAEHLSDEIHHLSCHCYTDDNDSWESKLRLTGGFSVSIKAMQAHLPDLTYERERSISEKSFSETIGHIWPRTRRTQREMPLIFLNACGSSKLSPKGITSFPQYFLNENKNCGFIGSEISIPDSFAAEFSKQFYLHLIKERCGVGEAIFKARRKMLDRHNNPLGILYISYSDPYLRVTKAVDDI